MRKLLTLLFTLLLVSVLFIGLVVSKSSQIYTRRAFIEDGTVLGDLVKEFGRNYTDTDLKLTTGDFSFHLCH